MNARKCPKPLFIKLQDARGAYKKALTAFNDAPSKRNELKQALTLRRKVYRSLEWEAFDTMRINFEGVEIVDFRFASTDFVRRYYDRLMEYIRGQKLILFSERHFSFMGNESGWKVVE